MTSTPIAFHAPICLDSVVPFASSSATPDPHLASLAQFNPETLLTPEAELNSDPADCLHGNSPRRPPAEFSISFTQRWSLSLCVFSASAVSSPLWRALYFGRASLTL